MNKIVIVSKDTKLLTFPDFETISTQEHASTEEADFQFHGKNRLFARMTKNYSVEYVCIKKTSEKENFSLIKKFKVVNLYSLACPKNESEDFAVGMTSGQIKILNYRTSKLIRKFETDKLGNCVMALEFSGNDHLAAVCENGLINIFGMKTGAKLQTLTFDHNSILCRYHPSRKAHVAVGSSKGAVVLYDTHTKKNLYQCPQAHATFCSDISMNQAYPDYLYSVGYDSIINIFDTRVKMVLQQIKSNYPFQTITTSDCGNYFCTGNIKGFVYGYDIRNLLEPLQTKKVDDRKINRIAFVPQSAEKTRFSIGEKENDTATTAETSFCKDNQTSTRRHSNFSPFAMSNSPAQLKNSSFNDEINIFLQNKEPRNECMSRLSISSRVSLESQQGLVCNNQENDYMQFLDDISDFKLDESSNVTNLDESFVNMNRLSQRKKTSVEKSRKSIALDLIQEESVVEQGPKNEETPHEINSESHQGKEKDSGSLMKKDTVATIQEHTQDVKRTSDEIDTVNIDPMSKAQFDRLLDAVNDMRRHLEDKIKFASDMVNFNLMQSETNIRTNTNIVNRNTNKKLDKMHEFNQTSLSLLCQSDGFAMQYYLYERENRELKQKVAELTEKLATTEALLKMRNNVM